MRHELREVPVAGAQKISRMCFVCGTDNDMSLHARFLSLADGRICAEFEAQEIHQSYPGRVHGGVISAILDETIGRVIQVDQPDEFGVTIDLSVKYRCPVPIGESLLVIAWKTKETSRIFEGEGQVLLVDGTVAAQGFARYFRQSLNAITADGLPEVEWFADERPLPASVKA
ncbi:MAG: PaaI family thioesterase [Coriobacteriales bacterium]|jgi:acyl-coenzyme A thioesterase PaaI-like protein|nr:PaaI family thioesterase [Coriobacteriales bacterium]